MSTRSRISSLQDGRATLLALLAARSGEDAVYELASDKAVFGEWRIAERRRLE
jgi:hypothetical protein